MTLDELRAEADKEGYILVKRTYNKLIPCLCGCNKRRRIQKGDKYYIECKSCERYATGVSILDAVNRWNEIMKPEKPKRRKKA